MAGTGWGPGQGGWHSQHLLQYHPSHSPHPYTHALQRNFLQDMASQTSVEKSPQSWHRRRGRGGASFHGASTSLSEPSSLRHSWHIRPLSGSPLAADCAVAVGVAVGSALSADRSQTARNQGPQPLAPTSLRIAAVGAAVGAPVVDVGNTDNTGTRHWQAQTQTTRSKAPATAQRPLSGISLQHSAAKRPSIRAGEVAALCTTATNARRSANAEATHSAPTASVTRVSSGSSLKHSAARMPRTSTVGVAALRRPAVSSPSAQEPKSRPRKTPHLSSCTWLRASAATTPYARFGQGGALRTPAAKASTRPSDHAPQSTPRDTSHEARSKRAPRAARCAQWCVAKAQRSAQWSAAKAPQGAATNTSANARSKHASVGRAVPAQRTPRGRDCTSTLAPRRAAAQRHRAAPRRERCQCFRLFTFSGAGMGTAACATTSSGQPGTSTSGPALPHVGAAVGAAANVQLLV